MSEAPPVRIVRDGNVAIVTIDNPPVNALSYAVRAGLLDALRAIEADRTIEAAVIACAGRTFVAGADIKEFGKPRQPPLIADIAAFLDTMTKPVVAALHGTALGGGLEVALACHVRIAAPATRLGLPEVKLGLLPGGGGTQRLPRAVGALTALGIIVSGEPVAAEDALASGLIDAMADGNLQEAATAQARETAGRTARRLRDEDARLVTDRADRTRFEAAAAALTKRARGMQAPLACVEAVRAALDLSFDEGLAREQVLFAELVAGDQSKALRHLFFAEREAAKLPDLPSGAKPRSVEKVAIIGAGTMGSGIAIAFADAGIPVVLIETNAVALQRGLATIERNYHDAAMRGRLADEVAALRIARVDGAINVEQAREADLVVEAVFEDLALKREIFSTLGRFARPGALLATNTSYLDVDKIGEASGRPNAVAGMHFFSPANVMRLVEIVRGADTTPETLAALVAIARRLRKVPVIVGNGHGFVGNRMLRQRSAAVERVLLEGALPQEVDAAMVEFGFPMGPLAASDLAGLDIGWSMRKAQGLKAPIADALCEFGRFGQKTGKGFYRYEDGSRTPLPADEVEAIIVETSERLGIVRRPIAAPEIAERLLLPVINEGARILAEGIAARPGDIDVIWVNGYGFPAWRGGPMFYADSFGLAAVRDRLEALALTGGDPSLGPAPLIKKLVAEGRTFGSLAAGNA